MYLSSRIPHTSLWGLMLGFRLPQHGALGVFCTTILIIPNRWSCWLEQKEVIVKNLWKETGGGRLQYFHKSDREGVKVKILRNLNSWIIWINGFCTSICIIVNLGLILFDSAFCTMRSPAPEQCNLWGSVWHIAQAALRCSAWPFKKC